MTSDYKALTNYLLAAGIENVGHSGRTYLAHLVNLYRLLEAQGYNEELCRAGMFHSIYGTELFQGFALPLDRRGEIQGLIGERAERLAYLNCAMDRAFFDRSVEKAAPPWLYRDRLTGEEISLSAEDFDDLCRIHLYDWLEQAPRSRHGWGYRRAAYQALARHLGAAAEAAYDRVFTAEPAAGGQAT
jgi:hypothetical protein